ncbi:hypothetical protein BDN71DRAFT_1511033 [Pleurotus eryngii]|uniref:Uncharacterized protein n=1 Tax=Pleurotus eryngii TaxID=5323 RepID=A0A9P5ZMV9_PLEER|nr:hypothetical protein BDN71DRAFT_1511033 [Pleurotus eryngii]
MSLTSDQEWACRELDKAIGASLSRTQAQKHPSEAGSHPAVDDDTDGWLFSDWETTIDDDAFFDNIKDPDDEVFDDLSASTPLDDLDKDDPEDNFTCSQVIAIDEENSERSESQAQECASTGSLRDLEYASDLHEKILETLIPLYCHLPGPGDTKFYSSILWLIILKSLKPNREWLPTRRITQLIAALLFTGRLVVMALMCRGLGVKSRYSQAFSAISHYLEEENEGPMPTLYLLLQPMNWLVSTEQGTLEFNAMDFTGTNIILDRKVLRLTDLGEFVETLVCESEAIISDQLFFGLDICDTAWSPGIVHNELQNISAGYSCFRDPQNEFIEHEHTLICTVLTHLKLQGHFHYLGEGGQIVWKAGACLAYIAACHEVEMRLFVASQTSASEPGRGTEIASHLITNICISGSPPHLQLDPRWTPGGPSQATFDQFFTT